jgi:hypothetical protein
MARSDLLISLVKAGNSGDQTLFRKVVESVIAEERTKKHDVLAERLAQELQCNGAAKPLPRPTFASNGTVHDLCFEINPSRTLDDLILPEVVQTACQEFVEEHYRAELLRSYGLHARNRILLAGSPGNGKTSLLKDLPTA